MKVKRDSTGFTIAELLVAMVVGGMFIASLTLVLVSHLHISQRARDLVLANAYAEAKIEELRSTGFNALALGTSSISSELPAELNSPKSGSLQVSSFNPATKQVDLTITYSDRGKPKTFSYRSYIGELGVGQY